MGCYYNQYHRENIISSIFHQVNSKDGVDFAMLFTLRLLRWGDPSRGRGLVVSDYFKKPSFRMILPTDFSWPSKKV